MQWRALSAAMAAVAAISAAGATATAAKQATRPLLGADSNGTIFSVLPSGDGFTRVFPCGMLDPTLHPDGRTYWVTSDLWRGRIFRLPAGEPITGFCTIAQRDKIAQYATGFVGRRLRVSPNGRRVVYLDMDGRLVTAAVNGTARRIVRARYATGANWSPDGRKLVVAMTSFHADCPTNLGRPPSSNPYCYTGEVQVMNADGSDAKKLYVVPKEKPLRQFVRITDVDWSGNGKILFTIRAGGQATQLAVIGQDGSGFRALSKWPHGSFGGVWSPDGRWIAFARRGTAAAPGGTYVMTATGRSIRQVAKDRAMNGLDW